MQINELKSHFDILQSIHGEKELDAVYGCGQINNPNICLMFMNPTGRNVSSQKNWTGLKAPWLGTKQVWNMLYQLGLLDKRITEEINTKKPTDWDPDFAEKIYKAVSENSIYITNLAKATQKDARPLPNTVFKDYLTLCKTEIHIIKPKRIIAFGNQVSSILLNKKIQVSQYRKKHELLEINKSTYKVYPVYYPVGQGMRNIHIAKEDIAWILENEIEHNNP